MIRLKSIEAENFKTYKSLKCELDNRGVVLILGRNNSTPSASSNGAGKTSFIDSISFALFGKTISDLSDKELVNNKVKKSMKVSLLLEVNGQQVCISRYRLHKEFGNELTLEIEGAAYAGDDKKDTQSRINDILGMDFELFRNSYLFGQGVGKYFAALSDGGQKEVLETILNVSRFSDYLKTCRDMAKEVKGRLRALDVSFASAEAKVEAANRAIQSLANQEVEHKKRKELEILSLYERAAALSESIEDQSTQDQILSLQKEIDEAQKKLDEGNQGTVDELLQAIIDLGEMVPDQELEINRIKRERETQNNRDIELRVQISNLQEALYSMSGLQAKCPTCKQDVQKDHIEKEVQALQEKIGILEAEQVALKPCLSKLISDLVAATDELETLKQGQRDAKIKIDDLEKETSKIIALKATKNGQLVQLKNKKASDVERCQEIVNQISKLEGEVSPYTTSITREESVLQENKGVLHNLEKERSELTRTLADYDFWENGFGPMGIRSLILDSIVPILDQKANEFSRILSDGVINIKFNTQELLADGKTVRDKFNVQVDNQMGASIYKGNSGGEKRRIDICILLALQFLSQQRAANSLNIIFFDEVFESLDSEGHDRIINLLQYIAETVPSVFVITHEIELASRFDNVMTITNNGGFSTVE